MHFLAHSRDLADRNISLLLALGVTMLSFKVMEALERRGNAECVLFTGREGGLLGRRRW